MPRPRSPAPETAALLRERLGDRDPALPFAEAVVLQAAHPLGRAATKRREVETAARVADILHERRSGSQPGEAAAALAADPELLAAFFQNIDLLYAQADPHADVVSGWIMRALPGPAGP